MFRIIALAGRSVLGRAAINMQRSIIIGAAKSVARSRIAMAVAGSVVAVNCLNGPEPSISGHYELLAVAHSPDCIGESECFEPMLQKQPSAKGPPQQRMTGSLVYKEDGRMWCESEVIHHDGGVESTSYSGRWWTHPPEVGGRPPHGNRLIVEHQVLAATNPSLVGKTLISQLHLSKDGKLLTTTDVQIRSGQVSRPRRLSGSCAWT